MFKLTLISKGFFALFREAVFFLSAIDPSYILLRSPTKRFFYLHILTVFRELENYECNSSFHNEKKYTNLADSWT